MLLSAAVIVQYTLSAAAKTMGQSGRVDLGVSLDPNDLAQIFVALIPLALYRGQMGKAWNRIWIGLAILLVIAVVPTQSRGAELGLAVVALVLISSGTSPLRRAINIVGVLACIAGFVLVAHGSGADRMSDFSDYSGGEGRMAIWKRGIYWMITRPVGLRHQQLRDLFRVAERQRTARRTIRSSRSAWNSACWACVASP